MNFEISMKSGKFFKIYTIKEENIADIIYKLPCQYTLSTNTGLKIAVEIIYRL